MLYAETSVIICQYSWQQLESFWLTTAMSAILHLMLSVLCSYKTELKNSRLHHLSLTLTISNTSTTLPNMKISQLFISIHQLYQIFQNIRNMLIVHILKFMNNNLKKSYQRSKWNFAAFSSDGGNTDSLMRYFSDSRSSECALNHRPLLVISYKTSITSQ